jgi:drug/metabolite transporter (DMT)-like permease
VGFFLWMMLISREKMGVATASVGAGFYILMPLCAWALYGESLANLQWVGIGLLTLGVICVSLGSA